MTKAEAIDALLTTGLVQGLRPVAQMTDEPRTVAFQAPLSDLGRSRLVIGDNALGQGTDFDPEYAKLKAIAETHERLCLRGGPPKDLLNAPFAEVEDAIDPADFLIYSDAQVDGRERRADELRKAPRPWAPARDLLSGRACSVPAELVWLGVPRSPDSILGESHSNGAAFGACSDTDCDSDPSAAAVAGLLELVERDSFVGWWHGCIPAWRIEAASEETERLRETLRRYRLESILLDTTSDLGFPSAVALTLDRTGGGPAVTCGAAARPDWNQAARHAIMESIGYRGPVRLDWARRSPDPETVLDSLDARIWHWYPVEKIPELESILEGLETASYASQAPHGTTQALREQLVERGWRWIVADMSLPEIKEAGFEAVRTIVPELHPIYFEHERQALWSRHYGELAPTDLPHPLA